MAQQRPIRLITSKPKKVTGSKTTFYRVEEAGREYLFAVTPMPQTDQMNDYDDIWSGDYCLVSLLNLTRKSYFLINGGPPLGWEYISEKYGLDDDDAAALTKALGKILGREIRLPAVEAERCLYVIPGGKEVAQGGS